MRKYVAKDTLLISTTGVEVEFDLVVKYSVSRYRAATLTQPEEPSNVEIEDVSIFICGSKTSLPAWIDGLVDNDAFKSRLMEHAAEQDMCAAEYAAEARREREWEDQL